MAKGKIVLDSVTTKTQTAIIKFHYDYKPGYIVPTSFTTPGDIPIRLYYSTRKSFGKATTIKSTFNYTEIALQNNPDIVYNGYVSGEGYYWTYTWTKPVQDKTKYWIQLRMQLYVLGDGLLNYKKYKSFTTYRNPKIAEDYEFDEPRPNQPLFEVLSYTNPHPEDEEDPSSDIIYDTEWLDFTDLISLPTYDVNYEDVTESWDDANYVSHVTRVRKRVTGKFSLWFSDLARYNLLMVTLKNNRERNGEGDAYVRLRLQVNNEIDEESTYEAATNRPVRESGIFTIKMDSNPWTAPIYGHYDKYQAVSVSVQQA